MALPYDLRKAEIQREYAARMAEQDRRNAEAEEAAWAQTAEAERRRGMEPRERAELERQEWRERIAAHEKAQSGPPENKALAGPPEDKQEGLTEMSKEELEALVEARGLTVEGTGAGGRVLKADLLAALGG